MTLLQHHILALGLTSAATLGLSLFVALKNPTRNLHRSLALYCFSLAWWSGWECAVLLMPTEERVFQLLRIEYVGVVFIPTLLCTTVSYLLVFSPRARRGFLLPLYACSIVALFVSTVFPTENFLKVRAGAVDYLPFWGWAGPRYWMFLVFFIGASLIGHGIVLRRWVVAEGQERTRLALFLVGSVIAYVGGCPEFALKYGVRLGWLNPFGLYGVPFHIGLVTYAIVQHQFLGIHVAIRRSLVYSILVTLLTIGYFGMVHAAEHISQLTFGYRSVWVSVMAFALMALAFQPLKIGIQRLVDRFFFRAPYEELAKRMERLEQEAQQTEKLKAVATLAAGMAHEIKNPLSSIKTFTEYLPQKYDDPDFREKFARIVSQEVGKINDLVQRLLEFAKPPQPQKQPVRISQLIDETVELLHERLLSKHIEVARAYTQDDGLWADPGQLKQVFLNVLLNSIDAMDHQGCISIATIAEDGHVDVVIADTGPGIPKKDLAHVCDPFYTTKADGTGLGLSVVHSIIREHGGHVTLDSDTGRGTTVRIQLPVDWRPETRDQRKSPKPNDETGITT